MPSATASTTARRSRSATAARPAGATRLAEVLGPHLTAVTHLLLPVQVLPHLRIVLYRPPRIVRTLLPLIGCRIVLIDISGPVAEHIICSRPAAIDRTTRASTRDPRTGRPRNKTM